MINITGAGTANVYFALGNYTVPGNDKNKQCLHGWGAFAYNSNNPVYIVPCKLSALNLALSQTVDKMN
jgi:hypothetical protein